MPGTARFKMASAALWPCSAENIFLNLQCWKICGFSSIAFSRKGRNSKRQRYPFRLAASRQATFPKGTALGGEGKLCGSAIGVPLGELARRMP